ncbi:hypothetical protein [Nannocystis radixulma]|uniref:Tetratricopeptide repeat-containing protein n=1 Tax=Nannocystis radixulma TaxID=2995305 RepID=A0ABT5B6N7_9BACT|nr:hypothetical protein [Nannocystis radixulma]MDC0669785.1 hypothetical protein [Nannocystis radixulma]
MLMRITLALTMLAPPSQKDADAAYNAGDYPKALEMYLERAADSDVHRPEALHGAHDSLIALHDDTREAAYLCRALAMARELLTTGSFADEEERAAWVELEARDVGKSERAGITCPAAPPKDAPPAPPAEEDARADAHQDSPPGVRAEGPAPLPASSDATSMGRPRGRVIAGASLMAAGLGLAGGMAATLVERRQANAAILALDRQATAEGRTLSEAELAEARVADRKYQGLTIAAGVVGAAMIVSLVTGVALLAAPPRHTRHARLRVQPGRLVLSF